MPFPPLRTADGARAPALLALRLFQAAAVSCLVAMGFAAAFLVPQGVAAQRASVEAPTAFDATVQDAIAAFECSTDGLGPDVIPSSALIRTGSGTLKHVTFDRGWAVHTSSSSPAVLIAVCASEALQR